VVCVGEGEKKEQNHESEVGRIHCFEIVRMFGKSRRLSLLTQGVACSELYHKVCIQMKDICQKRWEQRICTRDFGMDITTHSPFSETLLKIGHQGVCWITDPFDWPTPKH
jgi:hypothetical protein